MTKPPGKAPLPDAPDEKELAELACRAISAAARRLGLDPVKFARACAEGQIADLILDLRLARHGLAPADKARVEELLHSLGGLP